LLTKVPTLLEQRFLGARGNEACFHAKAQIEPEDFQHDIGFYEPFQPAVSCLMPRMKQVPENVP
jgi:hypothetical protein